MTEQQPPLWHSGGCYTAQQDRQMLHSLVCGEGVSFGACPAGDLEVTADGADMTVDVAAGSAFVEGDTVVCQGMYHVLNTATVTLAISASHPTDPRIDLIVARVYDSQYAGAVDEWALEVVEGVAGGGEPAIPANSLVLAAVTVNGGVTSIGQADIEDRREPAELCGNGDPEILVYEANNTFDKTSFARFKAVRVRAIGGGGAGAGAEATASGELSTGAGGSSGSYSESVIQYEDLLSSETVTIGAGGTGASAAGGSDGAQTSFGAHVTAPGGNGGTVVLSAGSTLDVGGAPGVPAAGSGDFAVRGCVGDGPIRLNGTQGRSGAGGNSVLGAGGRSLADVTSAGDTGVKGGGGSGAISRNGAASAGGDGGDGVIIVEIIR